MAFDWTEYLELAKGLAGEAGAKWSDEAAQRAAVSRAYYAAFCTVRNFAQMEYGFVGRKSSADHGALIRLLRDRERQELADHLEKLRKWRNFCDYENDLPDNPNQLAKEAIKIAGQVTHGYW